MRVVTLVPWRGGDHIREQAWSTVRAVLEDIGYPIFTGDSDGKWARAAACNAAAASAGEWDIALVADADTILEPRAVRRAVSRVGRTHGAARPHDRRWMLDRHTSQLAIAHGVESLKPGQLRSSAPGGGALVVHRTAWDAVGGYDEAFVEWGYEDSAMNISLVVNSRWELLPGTAWHLWHPAASLRGTQTLVNRQMLDEYRARHADSLAASSRQVGFDLNGVL